MENGARFMKKYFEWDGSVFPIKYYSINVLIHTMEESFDNQTGILSLKIHKNKKHVLGAL